MRAVRRVNRYRVVTQSMALLLVLTLVNTSRGAPGDVSQMAAPMLGADPPAATALRDGDASVSTQTGALQYSYPIAVPPGRLGNEPSLALSYSSQAPIYGGVAAGWSLSIPEIQRDTSKGILEQIGGLGPDTRTRTFLSTMAGSRPLIAVAEPSELLSPRPSAPRTTRRTCGTSRCSRGTPSRGARTRPTA